LIVIKVLVQEREWVADGDRRGGRVLRLCVKGLIGCRFWKNKIIRRGAGDRRR
jgi:hypothetical protein